ncbi:MAG: hypothetical protein KBH85_10040 [Lachnospiraceae bacterium]|jgi:RNA polymerase primary sigma factor|nr:hypothetical protein [Lachnospiraceae bacterium]
MADKKKMAEVINEKDLNDIESVFMKKLHGLEELAREQGGIITKEQEGETFGELKLDSDQMDMVGDFLKKNNIGIGTPAAPEDYMDEQELDYFNEYKEEIEKLPEYTDGEKEAFTLSAMAGDKSSQNKLIEAFLPNVLDIAKLYSGQGVLVEDLIGEGNAALVAGVSMLAALDNASEGQGMLTKMIMDAMDELIKEEYDSAKTSGKMVMRVNKVADKANELSDDLMRKVSVEEVMKETGLSRAYILEAMRLSGDHIDSIVKPDDAGF